VLRCAALHCLFALDLWYGVGLWDVQKKMQLELVKENANTAEERKERATVCALCAVAPPQHSASLVVDWLFALVWCWFDC
jgi:hypothetical protein